VPVRIQPSAKLDIKQGIRFYEEQETGVGRYFFDSISADISSLNRLAGIHNRKGELFRFTAKRFPYWIYYRIEGDVAFVVGVLDARQDPVSISNRVKGMQ
jgi:hypothetical protein